MKNQINTAQFLNNPLIHEEKTFEKYGYYSTNLSSLYKKVIAKCKQCGNFRSVRFCNVNKICQHCVGLNNRRVRTDHSGKIINGIEIVRYICKNKRGKQLYQCKCHCGNIFNTHYHNIKSGKTKSCSCFRRRKTRRYFTSQTINGIEFLEFICIKNGYQIYKCKCHCGKIFDASVFKIKNKNPSCGCLTTTLRSNAHRLGYGVAAVNELIRDYKNKAKRRKIEWNLTRGEVLKITQCNCYYCNSAPAQIKKVKTNTDSNGNYIYNGIDRVDNNQGYILDNCVACCRQCNFAKNYLSIDIFLEQTRMIYNKLIVKKELMFELGNNEMPTKYKKFESKFARYILPYGVSTINQCFHSYKKGAKYRNLEFCLSKDEFFKITTCNCFYCGRPPFQVMKSRNDNGDFIHTGIDRIDNSRGYILSNCAPCCMVCNSFKSNLTTEQFLNLITNIYNQHIKQ